MPRTCLVAVALILFALQRCPAELLWEKPIQEFQRSPEDRYVEAHFKFRNAGKAPVTIRTVRTSCGCTTAQLAKKTYVPGEEGEIVAKFTFGGRTGAQRKTIRVYTDEEPSQESVLDMRVFVDQALEISPKLVFWRTGEPGEPKVIQVTADPARPIRIRSVSTSNPQIVASLSTVKPGERYTISVRPSDTSRKQSAELAIETDFPPDAPRTYNVHARVK